MAPDSRVQADHLTDGPVQRQLLRESARGATYCQEHADDEDRSCSEKLIEERRVDRWRWSSSARVSGESAPDDALSQPSYVLRQHGQVIGCELKVTHNLQRLRRRTILDCPC